MFKSFRYLKPYIISVITIFVLVAIRAFLNLIVPNLQGSLIDSMIRQLEVAPELRDFSDIWIYGGLMLLATVVGIVAIITSGYMEARTSSNYARDIRNAMYEKVQKFSMTEVDKFTTSSLITRITNDITSLQSTVNMLLRSVIMQPIMGIGAIVMAFLVHPQLSTVLLFGVLAVFTVVGSIWAITYNKFKKIQVLVDKLNLVTRENLSGLRVVRAFNTQDVQAKKTKAVAKESYDINVFVNRWFTAMWPTMGFVMQLITASIIYFSIKGGFLFAGSTLSAGQLSTLIQYGSQTIMNFMMITTTIMMLPRAAISANRVMDVIDEFLTITEAYEPEELPEKIQGEIEFDDVSFQYPDADQPILNHVSFKAEPGKMTAIIGSTGSGKSTLINLIPRFYDVTGGAIKVDGIDIRNIKINDYMKHIGYVPQKGILFKGTIKSNIGFGQEVLDEALVKKAAQIAQAESFIENFEMKYDSEINQGGTNVSGGQRQRLSIARAIAKNPEIYIFDDSFSALDYKTDKKLRSELAKHIHATIIVVAQRINTIRHADQIIVLDKGNVVGIGTHDELIKNCEVYLEIAQSQLSKEELGL
ncbi:ABC transporter ATP-binding protein [Acholeplasma hippikon]|nr:ABC transporter ATP-binding protein [Acholeplasma hippikon]